MRVHDVVVRRVAELRVRSNDERPQGTAANFILAPLRTGLLFANSSNLVWEGNKEKLLKSGGGKGRVDEELLGSAMDTNEYLKKAKLRG